jgi:hypothetical protein
VQGLAQKLITLFVVGSRPLAELGAKIAYSPTQAFTQESS